MSTGIDYLVTMAKASRFVKRADASDGGWENMFSHMRGLLAQSSEALTDAGLSRAADVLEGCKADLDAAESGYMDASAALLAAVHGMHVSGFNASENGGLAEKSQRLRDACGKVVSVCEEITSLCEGADLSEAVYAATMPMMASLAEEMADAAHGVVESMESDLAEVAV